MIMLLRGIVLIFFIAVAQFGCAQTKVHGVVSSATGENVEGAIIRAIANDSTILAYTMSDENGKYDLSFSTKAKRLAVVVGLIGYNTIRRDIENKAQYCNFVLNENSVLLKEVVVKAPDISQRGDTLTYNLASYLSKGDYTLKDALKKLPGVEINDKGKIKYLGKDISNFYIEGLDLLGGKYNIATTNIPAEYVNSVQILNNHQPVKMDKNIFSDDVAVNVKLSKKAKFRPVGSTEASVGYGEKCLYQIGGSGMLFNSKFQTINAIKLGNINEFAVDEATDHFSSAEKKASVAEKVIGNISVSKPPIETDRYTNPSDRLALVNTINKLSAASTLKINAGYSYSKYKYEYGLLRNYYDGQQNIILNQSMKPESSLNKPSFLIQYENNASSVYIKNRFASWASFTKSELPTVKGDVESFQMQDINEFNLQNNFSISWLRRKLRWNVSSFLQTDNSPDVELSINDGNLDITQKSRVREFVSKTKMSATMTQGRTRLYLPLSLDYSYQKVNTVLDGSSGESRNDNSLNNLQVLFSPQYEYATSQLVLRTNLAIRNNFINERIRHDNTGLTKYIFSVCPELYLNYKVSARSAFRSKLNYARTLGDVTDFLMSPIQMDLTTQRISSGVLTDNKSLIANVHYDYKIPMKMWFFYADLIYENNKHNQLLSQSVTQEMVVQKNIYMPNRSNSISAGLGLTKRIRSINTKLSAYFSYVLNNETMMQNEQLIDLTSKSYAFSPSISSTPFKCLELDYDGNVYKTVSQYLSVEKAFWSQKHSFKMKLFPISSLQMQFVADITKRDISDDVSKTIALFDFGVSYRHKAIKIDLKLNNILNERKYSYTIYDTINTFTYDYKLRGRELLLSISLIK